MGAHGVLGSGALKAANTPSSGTTIATRPDWHSPPSHSAVATTSFFLLLLSLFFYLYLSCLSLFSPIVLNSVAQEPQDHLFFLLLFFLQIFSLFERNARVDLCQAVLSCLLNIFKCLVVSPHFILHANSSAVGLDFGRPSQENEFIFHAV